MDNNTPVPEEGPVEPLVDTPPEVEAPEVPAEIPVPDAPAIEPEPAPYTYAPVPPAPLPAVTTAPAAPVRVPMGRVIVVALLVALVFGGAAGVGGAYLGSRYFKTNSQTLTVLKGNTEEVISAAAAVAVPSVVNIDITGEVANEGSSLPTAHPSVPVSGNGSGVAFRAADDGGTYILTNDHVVADAKTIVVTDPEGNRSTATVVGTDPETDIAVVKVDAKIPVIATGDSEMLSVGQVVVAIGSPFGLQHSVTSGVVSAIHRSLLDGSGTTYPLVDVIQTDAAINPGNSGGALIDRAGALIGIPSAIYSSSGANDGIGFAVPVNAALRVADALIKTGSVEHPFLGISGQTVDAPFAATENLPVNEGAYVVETTKGTEAEKAGLTEGDIIVKLDDTKIRSMDDLILAVRRKAVGDTVTLSLYRDGKLIEVEMKVGIKPNNL
ncbi:MAG: serine protease [Actinobacteria bacterium HGW-Actinobacteria-6]|jgi:S1-C subfamily serine protease|nr:MAG: serine protease [Actinobacteria bacterium HGW-Actinobacteria-6]